MKTVSDKDEIMLMTEKGMIVRSPIKDIRSTGRSTQGVRLMRLDAGDKVASLAKIVPEDEDKIVVEMTVAIPTKTAEPQATPKIEPAKEVKKESKTEKKTPAVKVRRVKRK